LAALLPKKRAPWMGLAEKEISNHGKSLVDEGYNTIWLFNIAMENHHF
jgi:hypothetical protein